MIPPITSGGTAAPSPLRPLSTLLGRRRTQFARAALVGMVAAGAALLFEQCILVVHGFVEAATQQLAEIAFPHWLALVVVVPPLVLIAALLTSALAPEAAGSGIPHTKAVLLGLRHMRAWRVFVVKFFAGGLAIGAGLSLGREGPTIHIAAAAAALVASLLKFSSKAVPHLMACGAGAGLAAAFNAPLAGFIFVIEELRRELSPVTYGSALIAAVIADGLVRVAHGGSPVLPVSELYLPDLGTLPFIAVLGAGCGVAGVMFNRLLAWVARGASPLQPLSVWKRALLASGVTVLAAAIVPASFIPAQGQLHLLLNSDVIADTAVWALAALFLLKVALTIVAYAAGVPGGIFAPMLVQAALLGAFVGNGFALLAPEMASGKLFAIVGMVAYFAAVVRAPLTGVVLISEMTNSFPLLFVYLLASLTAYLVAEAFHEKPVYESLMDIGLESQELTELASDEPLIIHLAVEHESAMEGEQLRNLPLPHGALMTTVRRAGRELVPDGDTVFQAGDEIVVLLAETGERQVNALATLAKARTTTP